MYSLYRCDAGFRKWWEWQSVYCRKWMMYTCREFKELQSDHCIIGVMVIAMTHLSGLEHGGGIEKHTEPHDHHQVVIYCKYDHSVTQILNFAHNEVDPSQFLVPICRAEVRISVLQTLSPSRGAFVDQITVLKSECPLMGHTRLGNTMAFSE